MNIKHSIIALGAAGATAALVFGGSAVSTAFTSADNGSFHADSATVTSAFDAGDLALTNAIPGDSVNHDVTYTNTGTVPTTLSVTFGRLQNAGANPAALAKYLVVNIGSGDIPVTALQNQTIPLSAVGVGKVAANGGHFDQNVTLTLLSAAGNDAQASNVTLPYTVTATATH